MRVLLVYPQFPKSFWSFEKSLELVGKKALMPPLGLITVAAILPQTWEFKLVDCNIRLVSKSEWDWADLVIISAMIVQKEDFWHQIQLAKQHGKSVAVGGPYPTALPQEAKAMGADYLVLDEGEITLPMFVAALEKGALEGTFRATEKPDVSQTPVPRFDLLEMSAYDSMAIQFSRGCPFQCEFCDIIVLYGRKPRTKTPPQLIVELEALYKLGWRGRVFMVDDNFIGNKRNVKLLLQELKEWMAKHGYPFKFFTEASVNLAEDPELMELMVACNFYAVFLGIETPDEDSLTLTQKHQNTRNSLYESVTAITKSGLMVMSGFIIGFDGEKAGAGDRITQFVEQTSIPIAFFSMLQALPDTALWKRLEKEGRLRLQSGDVNQTTLMNFVPTRPIEEIAQEYIQAFWKLYDPARFLDRAYRHYLMMAEPKHKSTAQKMHWLEIRALFKILWRQGVISETRKLFWRNFFGIWRYKRSRLTEFIAVCARLEHFLDYREIVCKQISKQLAEFQVNEARITDEHNHNHQVTQLAAHSSSITLARE
ncbi:B12-binding domain-containing radical SAM protein [Trichocoleus desertorum AS-A10]|uniref:B12-binding domain-containing radical SAM protein n=1 Tax=Trichocoleus desertorum TaxID=1481672 RepID=UPI003298331A